MDTGYQHCSHFPLMSPQVTCEFGQSVNTLSGLLRLYPPTLNLNHDFIGFQRLNGRCIQKGYK